MSSQSFQLGSMTSIDTTSRLTTGRKSTSIQSSELVIETEDPTQDEIERKPWKYIGYKGYSEFLATENDFFIFRKFTSLNCRIALVLQDQLSVLEKDLDDLDCEHSKKSAGDINNGSFRDDCEDRSKVVDSIHTKLAQYNDFMIQQAQLKTYAQAYSPDVKSLRAWHANHSNLAIVPEEQEYLAHDSDLFCVVPKERTSLRRLLDRSLTLRIHPLWRKKEPSLPTYDQDLIYSISDKRIDNFIAFLILGVGAAMLIAPLWILDLVDGETKKLVIITIFILGFMAMLSSVTVAKPFETLAATAAYSAVLMVFLQIGSSSGS